MDRHFTATIYLLHQGKVLLHFHEKIRRWLPPGGHVEPNETPPEAAIREAKEESGLDVAIFKEERFWLNFPNAASFERPYLCLLEEIPAHGNVNAHQHMDMVYLGHPVENPIPTDLPNGFQWFGPEELLLIEKELFPDTREILAALLETIPK